MSKLTLERPATRKRVIEMVLAGQNDAQIAAAVSSKRSSVTRQAVCAFRKRHVDILKPAADAMVAAAVQHAVATKEARLADLQMLRNMTMEVIEGRDYGLEIEDVKMAANGDSVVVMKYDAALVAQFRGILADAAEEIGERQKAPLVDARSVTNNYIGLVGALEE